MSYRGYSTLHIIWQKVLCLTHSSEPRCILVNVNVGIQVKNVFTFVTFLLLPPPTKLGGGYVFAPVCLSVCLFVCLSVCEQLPGHNFSHKVMKFLGMNNYAQFWKWLNFERSRSNIKVRKILGKLEKHLYLNMGENVKRI